MSTWRSELIHYGTLVLPTDYAKPYICRLGDECLIQLTDMNAHNLDRPYKQYIGRIEEMERQFNFLVETIESLPGAKYRDRRVDIFLKYTSKYYDLREVESRIKDLYEEFVLFTNNNIELLHSMGHAYEYRELCKMSLPLQMQTTDGNTTRLARQNSAGFVPLESSLSTLSGVVSIENSDRLRRAAHYITRGNLFCHFEGLNLDDYKNEYMQDTSKKAMKKAEKDQKKHAKTVQKLSYDPNGLMGFVLVFQGDAHSVTYEKIKRAIDGAEGRPYAWPTSTSEANIIIARLDGTIKADRTALDRYSVLLLHEIQVLLDLTHVDGNSLIGDWALFIEKEKATYAALDMFEVYADTLRCDIWYPAFEEEHINQVLDGNRIEGTSSAFLLSNGPATQNELKVPSYFRNTGFTRGFQNFVNTYGVPRYREINPALITSVTLPFLFGVMYGDVGHGLFVMLFGLMLILSYEKLKISKQELITMMLGGRYMLFLMGCFAIYTGFIYNDILSIGVDLFGTRYYPDDVHGDYRTWRPSASQPSFPYPFGFDPVWKAAENELTFLNSYKMKYSIVVAGAHMGLGVFFKGGNALLKKDMVSLFFEFTPQLIFFSMFVFYLDFMIIYKWITPGLAPNLINSIIEFAMMKKPEFELYPNQHSTQKVMLVIMLICIPWMLIPKPIIEKMIHDKKMKEKNAAIQGIKKEDTIVNLEKQGEQGDQVIDAKPKHDDDEDGFSFGEEFIHQLIETIEFALGAVSNTASYLRLWALSLAHQQLAIVFFDMTIGSAMESSSGVVAKTIVMILMFGAFAGATFVVMLCMDSLECYLHALRLQWVEFQSKFFKADGHQFRAFNFEIILTHVNDDA